MPDAILLLVAGVGAGLSAGVAGLASLVSYPALLAVGLPPVTANATNTVALFAQGLATIHGSVPELRAPRPRQLVRQLLPWAALGGITGGTLLLLTPGDAFARVVPFLIGAASIAVLLPARRPAADPGSATDVAEAPTAAEVPGVHRESLALRAAAFAVCIYGGYFGAAAGVLMVAVLLALTGESLRHSSAVRTALLFVANAVAAVAFAVFGSVDWAAAVPMAAGLAIGGRVGPVLLRHAPAWPLRIGIAVAGLALAVRLAV